MSGTPAFPTGATPPFTVTIRLAPVAVPSVMSFSSTLPLDVQLSVVALGLVKVALVDGLWSLKATHCAGANGASVRANSKTADDFAFIDQGY